MRPRPAHAEEGSESELESQAPSIFRFRPRLAAGAALLTAVVVLLVGTPSKASGFLRARTTSAQKLDESLDESPAVDLCEENEEMFGGLCYATCGYLTEGDYPIRTTAFSCCAAHPCGFNQKVESLFPCQGFDVNAQASCPHAPGGCADDEEYDVGMCYKKCTLLTHGEYPYRVAAASCCKYDSIETCINPMNDMTRPEFDAGAHWPYAAFAANATLGQAAT